MFDCNDINTCFDDFEELEFATKKKHAEYKLWRCKIIYKSGLQEDFIKTASEIDVNVLALHYKIHRDCLLFKYTEIDVQKIV